MTALPTIPATTELSREVARRRTFAIISHPDAGKTTLTEKLLLYGGAIEMAGAVRARKGQRHATSDWMAMEQTRGISITSTALQFEYEGYCLNLLDTPGHEDFSKDTYRTLAATDSAVMVLDSAKGIEPQTRKLFEVCRQRGVPIFTFMNKCDRPMKHPLTLLDELKSIRHLKLPRSTLRKTAFERIILQQVPLATEIHRLGPWLKRSNAIGIGNVEQKPVVIHRDLRTLVLHENSGTGCSPVTLLSGRGA